MFKERFKFYKRMNSLQQQSDVIDFNNALDPALFVSVT